MNRQLQSDKCHDGNKYGHGRGIAGSAWPRVRRVKSHGLAQPWEFMPALGELAIQNTVGKNV